MSKWIDAKKQLPEDSQWIVMHVNIADPDIAPFKKVVYELGMYVATPYRIADKDARNIKTDNYELRSASIWLLPGWYRVYNHADGVHYEDLPGDVALWKDFLGGAEL